MSEQLERYQQLIRDAFPKDETPREIKPIPPEIWFKNLQGLLILHQLEHLTLEKEGLAVTITPTQYFTHYPNDRQFSFAFQSGVAILDKSPCSIDTLLFCINDLEWIVSHLQDPDFKIELRTTKQTISATPKEIGWIKQILTTLRDCFREFHQTAKDARHHVKMQIPLKIIDNERTGAAMSIAMSYFKAAIDHMIDVPLPEPRQIKFDSDQMAQTGTVDTYENHSEADESSLDDLDWAPKIPPKPTPTKRSRADTTPNFDPVFALLGIPTGDTTPWIDDQGRPQLIDIEGSRIHNEPKFKPASFKHSGPELAIEFPEE